MAELNLKNFPDALHRDLKIAAATSGTTIRDFVIEVLEAAVAKTMRKTR